MNGTSHGLATPSNTRTEPTRLERWTYRFSRHWILLVSVILGFYAGLPFLAPVLMKLGWETPARLIYLVYSFLCHQLPQRSFFLFGSELTYSLAEIQTAWIYTLDPIVLRQFTGNPEMGWKVAWSDRMVAMFTSLWLFGMLWGSVRRRLKPLPVWGLALFLLPMFVDGTSHFVSDLYGIGQGFRDSNAWLAAWTNHAFPASFYAGDVWGSFNSIVRLLTGFLFGLGIVWFGFTYLDDTFAQQERYLNRRLTSYQHEKMKAPATASSRQRM